MLLRLKSAGEEGLSRARAAAGASGAADAASCSRIASVSPSDGPATPATPPMQPLIKTSPKAPRDGALLLRIASELLFGVRLRIRRQRVLLL